MKILYLHQYFKTPEEGGAIRSYYLATAMAKAGHKVQLISGWNNTWEESRLINGFTIHYVPVRYSNQMDAGQRKAAFFDYLFKACHKLNQLGQFNLAYVSSTPLTIGLLALYLKWIKKTPYVFEVRDLWPEAPWQLGAIKSKLVYAGLKLLEKTLYRKAKGVVALSPPIKLAVNQVAGHTPVLLATNMADTNYFSLPAQEQIFISEEDVRKFIICYTGAAGPANGLNSLVAVARVCMQARLPILFLIMAEGQELANLKEAAYTLTNLRFMPYGNKDKAKACLQLSHAAYISFADYTILQTCSPNKLFDALAAGKLIITNTPGWIKDLVEANQCGFYTDIKHPQEFIKKIGPFIQDKKTLVVAQENARALATTQFSVTKTTKSILGFLEELMR